VSDCLLAYGMEMNLTYYTWYGCNYSTM